MLFWLQISGSISSMQISQTFDSEIVKIIHAGGIGVIPTDTVYGIVGLLHSQDAIERMYRAKDRETNKPVGTILIADISQIKPFVSTHDLLGAQPYWPGPVSVVMNVSDNFAYAHRGMNSLAFRIPDDKKLIALLQKTGPLASTSANMSGERTVSNIQEALSLFRENMDFYVEGGDMGFGKPSKIIQIEKNGEHRVIRGG